MIKNTFLILSITACIIAIVLLYNERSKSEYFRSKYHQNELLLIMFMYAEGDIERLLKVFPGGKKTEEGILYSKETVSEFEYVRKKGVKLLDFYGFLFQTNEKNEIENAYLYKP